MNVAFAGGRALGCAVLKTLIEDYAVNVKRCFVNGDDSVAGAWYPSAANIALANLIPVSMKVIMPEDLQGCDMLVVAYYHKILPPEVYNAPKRGSINVHTAISQRRRGCYPSTYAILEGDTETGVTIHQITDDGIDAGPILGQVVVSMHPGWTGEVCYGQCVCAGALMFARLWPDIRDGKITAAPQPADPQTPYQPRVFPDREVHVSEEDKRRIRAVTFTGFPAPYVMIAGQKWEIRKP